MSIDASTLPISPMVIITAGAYCLFMLFVGGPEMSSRAIANSTWHGDCETALKVDLSATRKPRRAAPEIPNVGGMLCNALELYEFCHMIPDPNAPAREAERRLQEAESARIRNAIKGIGDSCTCATAVYTDSERLELALWAGSGRMITPRAVENRTAALTRALKSPTCALDMGIRQ